MPPDKIPMYVTHAAPPAKLPPKEKPDAPTEQTLTSLLDNGCADTAKMLIAQFEMPYEVSVDGKALLDKLKGTELWLRKFATCDEETLALKSLVMTLSKHDDEVLTVGETGTGKELLSRALIGNRTGYSLAINCAGLPENLVESELFGYAKGAFTGAEGTKQGLMQEAKDGLLFMDEIGELPLAAQGKLLRALQDKKVRRVGAKIEEEINCRFVFATNKNLRDMVQKGLFRQDLYARISTFELHVKPLRTRHCDIPLICKGYKGGEDFHNKYGEHLKDGRLSIEHNVRSLYQYIRRFVVTGKVVI